MADREGFMLAKPYEERLLRRFRPPYILQPKLKGLRCRVVPRFDGKGYMLLSSSAAEVVGVPHILEQVNRMGSGELEFDGEFYVHGMAEKDILGIVNRKVNIHPDHECMELHIFDIIDETTQQNVRTDTLAYVTRNLDLPNIKIVPSHKIQSHDEITDLLGLYLNMKYEGIVIRDSYATYERKRSFNVLKMKPEEDDFYIIVGYREEVSIHGEPKNRLGAIWCEDTDGTRFYVGSGFDAEQRELLWEQKESLINKIAHVKYTSLNPNNKPVEAVIINIMDITDVKKVMGLSDGDIEAHRSEILKQFEDKEDR